MSKIFVGNFTGPKGDVGAAGPQGPKGDIGDIGPVGPKGKDGVGIGQTDSQGVGEIFNAYVDTKKNMALSEFSHAEGYLTVSNGQTSHTEGRLSSCGCIVIRPGSVVTNLTVKTFTISNTSLNHFGITDSTSFINYIRKDAIVFVYFLQNNALYREHILSASYGSTNSTIDVCVGNHNYLSSSASDYILYIPTVQGPVTSHSEGIESVAFAAGSHAEGNQTIASGITSHSEGIQTITAGNYSHSEGTNTISAGYGSHAEGYDTKSTGTYSHAEGSNTIAIGTSSHAEGGRTSAKGNYSHSEGGYSGTSWETTDVTSSSVTINGPASDGAFSHAEGQQTYAQGSSSHAEGNHTKALNSGSHAEGIYTVASGLGSHAEGSYTTASGVYSHAAGNYTTAANTASTVFGKYNKALVTGGAVDNTTGDAFVIGKGTSSSNLANAFRVSFTGTAYGLGTFNTSGADYAEFIYEWQDGNPSAEDRVGHFVTIENKKLKYAGESDYIAGVTSGFPSVVGSGDEDWLGRWQRDIFNRIQYEEVETPVTTEKLDADGYPLLDDSGSIITESTGAVIRGSRPIQVPDYDPAQTYIERKDRPEWDYVGMLGQLSVYDDGTCEQDGYCKCTVGGIAAKALSKSPDTYRVLERLSDNIIKILFR